MVYLRRVAVVAAVREATRRSTAVRVVVQVTLPRRLLEPALRVLGLPGELRLPVRIMARGAVVVRPLPERPERRATAVTAAMVLRGSMALHMEAVAVVASVLVARRLGRAGRVAVVLAARRRELREA